MRKQCAWEMGGREGGREGCLGVPTSSVLTWLWVPAPWRSALLSLLSSLSGDLSSMSYPLLRLYFPSSLTAPPPLSSLSPSAPSHSRILPAKKSEAISSVAETTSSLVCLAEM